MLKSSKNKWFAAFLPYQAASGMLDPVLPLYAIELGGNLVQVGLVSSLFSLFSTFGSVFWGKLSDSLHSRKAVIIVGFIFTCITMSLLAFARNIDELIFIRSLQGFLIISSIPVAAALIVDTGKGGLGEKIGEFSKISGTGWVLGLIVGWLLVGLLGLRFLFLASAIFAAISILLGVVLINEPVHKAMEKPVVHFPRPSPFEKRRYHPHLLFHLPSLKGVKKDFYLYLGGAFLMFMGGPIIYTLFPVYLAREFKVSNESIFSIYILNSLASAIAYQRFGVLSDKLGHKRMLTLALVIRSAVFLFYIFLPFLGVSVLYIISGLTWSVLAISGSVLMAMLASSENEGEAMGAYNAVIGIATIVGSLSAGLIVYYLNYSACFIAGALVTFLSAFIISQIRCDFKLRL
jgi:MFS family permease